MFPQLARNMAAVKAKPICNYPKLGTKASTIFPNQTFDDNVNLVTHVKQGDDPNMDWKIALPESIINQVIKCFYQVLGHPGNNRMRDAIQARHIITQLSENILIILHVEYVKNINYPEDNMISYQREMLELIPDKIAPWAEKIRDRWYEFKALTCIDMVTSLVELIRVDRKTSAHIRSKLEQFWLARYP